MIDVNSCQYEESFRDEDCECTVHYYMYTNDIDETEFCSEEDYGNDVSMCISLTIYDDGGFDVQMSPIVEDGDDKIYVGWRTLYQGINYTDDIIHSLYGLIPSENK